MAKPTFGSHKVCKTGDELDYIDSPEAGRATITGSRYVSIVKVESSSCSYATAVSLTPPLPFPHYTLSKSAVPPDREHSDPFAQREYDGRFPPTTVANSSLNRESAFR